MIRILFTIFLILILYFLKAPYYELIENKIFFYHYDFIELKINPPIKEKIYFFFTKKGEIVKGIGNKLFYVNKGNKIRIPCPWNLPQGIYTIKAFSPSKSLRNNFSLTPVIVTEKEKRKMEKNILAITWENNKPFSILKIPSPFGETYNWKGIVNWAKFLGANTIFFLTGQTFNTYDKVWLPQNIKALPLIAEESKKNNIMLGAWVSCYLSFGENQKFYKKIR